MSEFHLTPARRRVLEAVAAGHIRYSLEADFHHVSAGVPVVLCCSLGYGQAVSEEVGWLLRRGLVRIAASLWELTDAGHAIVKAWGHGR